MKAERLKKTVKVKDILEDFLHKAGAYSVYLEQQIIRHWEQIAGPEISPLGKPLKIENGVLWVSVENACLRNEWLFLKDQLRDRANAWSGRTVIKKINLTR